MESERSSPEWEKPVNGPITQATKHKEGDNSKRTGKFHKDRSTSLIEIKQVR